MKKYWPIIFISFFISLILVIGNWSLIPNGYEMGALAFVYGSLLVLVLIYAVSTGLCILVANSNMMSQMILIIIFQALAILISYITSYNICSE